MGAIGDPNMPRTFSLRLDEDLAARLSDVASVMGRSQADLIRQMLTDNLDQMLASPQFQAGVQARQEALDRLASFSVAPENSDESSPLPLVE
jgi:predicted transcriptional regulator